MQRNYRGKLEKITKVVHDRGTGEIRTYLLLVNGKFHASIVFRGIINSDVIGHKVSYTQLREDGVLIRERLVDLKTGREYISVSEF